MNDLMYAALLFAKNPSPFETKPGRAAVRLMDVVVTVFVFGLLSIVAVDRFRIDSNSHLTAPTDNGAVADVSRVQDNSDLTAVEASAR